MKQRSRNMHWVSGICIPNVKRATKVQEHYVRNKEMLSEQLFDKTHIA